MISTLVRSHREDAFLFRLTLTANCSALSTPKPIPAKEWTVTPPILHEAIPETFMVRGTDCGELVKPAEHIPVLAVIATASGIFLYFFCSALIISRSKTDLPVPTK